MLIMCNYMLDQCHHKSDLWVRPVCLKWTRSHCTSLEKQQTSYSAECPECASLLYVVWCTQHAPGAVQEHKEVIAEAMEVAEYNSGQAVYCQGDTGSRFYVIKEGSVTCSKAIDPARTPAVSILNAGQYFGERALIKDEIRSACVFVFSAKQCHRSDYPSKCHPPPAAPQTFMS